MCLNRVFLQFSFFKVHPYSNAHWKHNCNEGEIPLPGERTRRKNPSRGSLISKSMETYQNIYIQRFSSCLFVLLLRPEVLYHYGTFPRQQQQPLPNLFTRCKSVSVIIILDGLLIFFWLGKNTMSYKFLSASVL